MDIALGARLMRVARSIPKCKTLVDCGCDHGHISIYAAKNGIAEKITASDINRGPLSRAEHEISLFGQSAKITTVLTDGLNGLGPHDCVVIAGMGGETIADIISRAEWTKDSCTLVLQPMTKTEILRSFLYDEGFEITEESFVRDGGHLYCVIIAKHMGKREREPYEKYISRKGLESELSGEYTDKTLSRLKYEYEKKCEANTLGDCEKAEIERNIASLSKAREMI